MTAAGFDYNPTAAWFAPRVPYGGQVCARSSGRGRIGTGHASRPRAALQEGRGPLGWRKAARRARPPSPFSHRVRPCTRAGNLRGHLPRLASLGYFVCIPNFSGSTGFGIPVMDAVLGDGCGVADLADCVACARFLTTLDGVDTRYPNPNPNPKPKPKPKPNPNPNHNRNRNRNPNPNPKPNPNPDPNPDPEQARRGHRGPLVGRLPRTARAHRAERQG